MSHTITDLLLDVVLVSFPLGVCPKLHFGELVSVHRVVFVVLVLLLFEGARGILILRLLHFATIAGGVFPRCPSCVFLSPCALRVLLPPQIVALPLTVALLPPLMACTIAAHSEAGRVPGQSLN